MRLFLTLPRGSLLATIFATTLALSGCVPYDADYSKAVSSFQDSANKLTQAYLALLANENAATATYYLDDNIKRSKPITSAGLKASARVTPEQIKIRTATIAALSAYMTALASLAAGAPATKVEADAKACGDNLAKLSSLNAGISGPLSTAIDAMGGVLEAIEKRVGERVVHDEIERNKDKITALFALIDKEAVDTYTVQKTLLEDRQSFFVDLYNKSAIAPAADPVALLAAGDRVQQSAKDLAVFSACDPGPAIEAFQKAYDALIKAIVGDKKHQKESFADVLAAAQAFGTAVTPLAQSAAAFAHTL